MYLLFIFIYFFIIINLCLSPATHIYHNIHIRSAGTRASAAGGASAGKCGGCSKCRKLDKCGKCRKLSLISQEVSTLNPGTRQLHHAHVARSAEVPSQMMVKAGVPTSGTSGLYSQKQKVPTCWHCKLRGRFYSHQCRLHKTIAPPQLNDRTCIHDNNCTYLGPRSIL